MSLCRVQDAWHEVAHSYGCSSHRDDTMDVDDNKYEKLRAKMKAPLLPAKRIGDAVPKKRWLVSSRLSYVYQMCQALHPMATHVCNIVKRIQAAERTLPTAMPHNLITSHYIPGARTPLH